MTARERTGRRGLARVGRELSERETAVLASVADHRYLTTRQIEALHFRDHDSQLTAARICRRILTRLLDAGVLARLDRRVGGIRAGSAAYIWILGAVGDRLIRIDRGEGTRRRFHEPSPTFLDHSLAIADTHVGLVEASRSGTVELSGVDLEPSCWRNFMGSGGDTVTLRPDLYVVTAAGNYESCWFLEVDRGTESLPTVMRKCAQYNAYRRSGIEQQQTGVFPRVVWIVPSEARRAKLVEALHRARDLEHDLFRVVLPSQLVALVAEAGGAE